MRLYDTTHNQAVEDSRIFHRLFTDHLADFTDFDPSLNAAFAADWLTAIENAESQPTDESTLDLLQGYTDAVAACEKDCLRSVNDVRYYAGKAFSGDKNRLREFGLHQLKHARNSTTRFIIWMRVLHKRAVKYQDALLEADMTIAAIDAILTRAQALYDAETDQEYWKLERLTLTRERETAYTAMWQFVLTVSEAAAIAFEQNPEKHRLFKLPDYRKNREKDSPEA